MKHTRFSVPGTHETHVWVSLIGDYDTAIVNGERRTVPKVCINCMEGDAYHAAEVVCTAIGKRWPVAQPQPEPPEPTAEPEESETA